MSVEAAMAGEEATEHGEEGVKIWRGKEGGSASRRGCPRRRGLWRPNPLGAGSEQGAVGTARSPRSVALLREVEDKEGRGQAGPAD